MSSPQGESDRRAFGQWESGLLFADGTDPLLAAPVRLAALFPGVIVGSETVMSTLANSLGVTALGSMQQAQPVRQPAGDGRRRVEGGGRLPDAPFLIGDRQDARPARKHLAQQSR